MARPKRPSRPPDDPACRSPADPADRTSARGGDLSLDRDPGDAVPPGVAPRPPAPAPSEEDLRAREALEKHLGKRSREKR